MAHNENVFSLLIGRGVNAYHVRLLAGVIVCAHEPNDVFMGCRTVRRTVGVDNLCALLGGPLMQPFWGDGECDDVAWGMLAAEAHAFVDALVGT